MPPRGFAERVVRASRPQLGAGILVGAVVITAAVLPFLPAREPIPAPDKARADAVAARKAQRDPTVTAPPVRGDATVPPWSPPAARLAPAVPPRAEIPVFAPAAPIGAAAVPDPGRTHEPPRGARNAGTDPDAWQPPASMPAPAPPAAAPSPADAPPTQRDAAGIPVRDWGPTAGAGAGTAGAPDPGVPPPWTSVPQPGLRDKAEFLLAKGDVASARLWLDTAADRGDAEAMFRLAETYDPVMLGLWQVLGLTSDRAKARELYAKALSGGVEAARERLDRLARDPSAPVAKP